MEKFFDDSDARIKGLVNKFTGYSITISENVIRNWIRQFDEEDWSLALKILFYIDYYDNARLCRELQGIHRQLLILPNFNINNTYFSPFCETGHSGEIILERYRFSNRLKRAQYNNRFKYLTELNLLYGEVDSNFIFLEDFIGTGDATIRIWNAIEEFVPNKEKVYLAVICGHDEGIRRVEAETALEVISNKRIYEYNKMVSPSNLEFSHEEKAKMIKYCIKAREYPEGYGNCQSNVVFYYRAPNNTISIIRSNNEDWQGLFIRNI